MAAPEVREVKEYKTKKSVFEKSAKIFFFCFMNESKALSLAKTLSADLVDTSFLKLGKEQSESIFLSKIDNIYKRQQRKKIRQGMTPILGSFEVPKSLDLGAWREFKRSSCEDEFYMTCLFYIGGHPLESIASVLGISLGTAKLRLSRGAKSLGTILLKEYLY